MDKNYYYYFKDLFLAFCFIEMEQCRELTGSKVGESLGEDHELGFKLRPDEAQLRYVRVLPTSFDNKKYL